MSIIYRPDGRALEYAFLAANHYVGCGHGCYYCYVPAATRNTTFHTKQSVRPGVLGMLRKEASKYRDTDCRVLLCFSCDPYQPLDVHSKTTRDVIKILQAHNIPIQILTKGGARAQRDFDLYRSCDIFGTTLTTLTPSESHRTEPQAALPADRIETIKEAKNKGIETWVSLEPVLDAKQSLQIIRETHSFVDLFRIGKLNHRASNINWRAFGKQAINLCRDFGTDYYIKADLATFLDGITFHNTDKRKIERPKARNETLF